MLTYLPTWCLPACPQVEGGPPQVTVSTAWSAQSDAPQRLLAAGLSPGAPAATAHTRPANPSGSLASHRVLIWWPKLEAAEQQQQQQQQQQQELGCAGPSVYSIGTEIIRHPVEVRGTVTAGARPPRHRPQQRGWGKLCTTERRLGAGAAAVNAAQ